jgi:transcriptional antiterminator NusG
VDKLGVETREQLVVDYTVGANVEIIDGPMTGFIGMVDSIDTENRKVKVTVSMFGRDTLAELDLTQVKPV